MADVLITYAPENAEFALRVGKCLERAGLSVSRGPQQYAADWPSRLYDAVDSASATIALWSRDALQRDWVLTEAAIAAHFGQLISFRTDQSLDVSLLAEPFRVASQGDIVDLFEQDIAPRGWGEQAMQSLARSLAPVAGHIRALKARGPVTRPAPTAPGEPPSAEEAARTLSAHFTYLRHNGSERPGKSLPAFAATRRETAFKAAYTDLASMEYPSDVRASLFELADPSTARFGLARLYAEALARSDTDFWALIGRIASPLSTGLCAAALQRSGAHVDVIGDLLDPRDTREMHTERYGRARGAKGGVMLWPLAAVAVGVLALMAGPPLQRLVMPMLNSSQEPKPVETATMESSYLPAPPPMPAPIQTPVETKPPIRAYPLEEPPPTVNKASPPTPPTPAATPAIKPAPAIKPPPAPAVTPPPAPVIAAAPPVGAVSVAAPYKLKLCRQTPGEGETLVTVMEGERIFDVAARAFLLSDRAQIRRLTARNSGCLATRKLVLADGRELSGSSLIFPGDQLIVPVQPAPPEPS